MTNRRVIVFKHLDDLIAFMVMVEAKVVLWWEAQGDTVEITTAIGDGVILRCRPTVSTFNRWLDDERTPSMIAFEGRVGFEG